MSDHSDVPSATTNHDDLSAEEQRKLYRKLAAAAALLVVLGTIIFRWLEDWGWIDSFYFSVVTATTVGFGDLSPETDAGKLVSVAYIVFGVSLIAAYLDVRFKRAVSRRASRAPRKR